MKLSIRVKYPLFVLLPLLVIYVVVLGYEFSRLSSLREQETIREVTDEVSQSAGVYSSYFTQAERLAQESASVVERSPDLSEDEIFAILAAKVASHPFIYGAALAFEPYTFHADRRLFSPYVHRNRARLERLDIGASGYDYTGPEWEWWNQPRDSGKPGWTSPYFDDGAGDTLMITYAVPFRWDGKFRGVATVDVELPTLHKLVGSDSPLKFRILQADGRFVYHDNPNIILRDTIYDRARVLDREDIIGELVEKMFSGTPGSMWVQGFQPDGSDSLVIFAPIPDPGWAMFTLVPEDEILAPVRIQSARNTAVLAGTLVLIALCVWGVLGTLSRPLQDLEKAIQMMATGERREELSLPTERGDEIGSLARSFADMSEKLEAREETIRQLEGQRFRTLVRNIPGVTFRRRPDREAMEFISAPVVDLTGYPAEEFEVGGGRMFLDSLHSEDLESVKQQLEDALAEGRPWEVEYRVHHRDDSVRWVRERGQALYGGDGKAEWLDGIVLDVTAQKEAQQALQESGRRLQGILDHSTSIVYLKDLDGRYLLANREFEKLSGVSREEIKGKELAGNEWADAFREDDRKVLEDRTAVQTEEAVTVEGRRMIFLVDRYLLFDADGVPYALCGFATDISERKAMEDALEQARQAADSANKAKSDFLANMSHEIRTPMNAVIGLTHLALSTELTTKQRDYLGKIQSSAHNLLGIINDILDFSKIEAGKLDMEELDFSLDDVLENVFHLLDEEAGSKGLELLLDRAPEAPDNLVGDPLRLGQVLLNLVNNALKFTASGEVVVRVGLVTEEPDAVELRFEVRDTGIGMNAEQMKRLFQSFSQADTSTTRKYGGTGLGLAISKSLVEMMKGSIGVDSQVGQGSTFSFIARFGQQLSKQKRRAVPGDLRGLRVLVVDDNATAREVLCQLVESFSFEAFPVSSGEEALAELEAGRSYGLVLMDWKMPGMSGVEASRRIKRELELAEVPRIIMVTNYGREEVRAQARHAGLDAFLIKPVSPSVLFDTILGCFSEAHEDPDAGTPDSRERLQGFGGARVLLVEDNEINQQVARELLEQVDLEVTVANHGREALEKLDAEEFRLVLMDVQMPEMDGYEATRRIRQQDRFAELPVVAMTAHAMAGDRERCLEVGMNEHVTKPIDPDRLYQVLREFLDVAGQALVRPEDESGSLPEIEGLDSTSGLARVGGNHKLYRKLLRDFSRNYADVADRLLKAGGDTEEVRQLTHAFKGVAGNLGAAAVFEAAGALEAAARQDKTEDFEALILAVRQAWSPLCESFLALKTTEKPAPEAAQEFDRREAQTGLTEMLEFLHEGDPQAEECLSGLEGQLVAAGLNQELFGLRQQVDDFDFDEAAETVALMLKRIEKED